MVDDLARHGRPYERRRTPPEHVTGSSGPLLEAQCVGRTFGARVALIDIDLRVRAGDSVALVGPNGAGKSTLLSLLAGALSPTSGRLVHRGPGREIGWVPQRPAIYSRLSALENLEHFARLERVASPAERARRLLEIVEVSADPIAAGTLSSGNQQRLNLAIALLADPEVLLLDEPTASLDPRQRRRFWQLAHALPERGGAIVFATQHLVEVDEHASDVLLLEAGRSAFSGTVADWQSSAAIEGLR